MTLRTSLMDYGLKDPLEPLDGAVKSNISNNTANKLEPSQRIIFECILSHPKGINDKGIATETGIPVTSVNARRNELVSIKLVRSIGVKDFPDYKNCLRSNKLWAAINDGGSD